ncbi:MAG: signal peptidase II [Candidatus Omnitrophota bacterium]|nr:signal peptidase II [Candidatus Omnitrophota bacterium]
MPAKRGKKEMTVMAGLFVAALLILDQITKISAVMHLKLNQSYPVMEGILHFTRVHNTGAAFGFLKEGTAIFIFLSIVTILLIVFYPVRDIKNTASSCRYLRFGLLFILAGTIGNLIDRIRFGYVVDFIDLRVWPVFNVADIALTLGGACILYHIIIKVKSAPNII